MTLSVGVLMDPISDIKVAKDTTLAMLLEATRRGHDLHYFEQGDLALREGAPWVWVALSGLVTLLLGGMILAHWPASSLFVLGMFLGIDLIFAGTGWIAMGLALRRI